MKRTLFANRFGLCVGHGASKEENTYRKQNCGISIANALETPGIFIMLLIYSNVHYDIGPRHLIILPFNYKKTFASSYFSFAYIYVDSSKVCLSLKAYTLKGKYNISSICFRPEVPYCDLPLTFSSRGLRESQYHIDMSDDKFPKPHEARCWLQQLNIMVLILVWMLLVMSHSISVIE